MKFYPASSAFKRALGAMAPGDTIYAAQLAGNFTLPADPEEKLAFIAGGIGITPFRSMLQYLLDRQEARPIVVLYGNETPGGHRLSRHSRCRRARARHQDDLRRGARRRARPISGLSSTRGSCARRSPTIASASFYISGPQAMVKALRRNAASNGRSPLADQGRLLPRVCVTA